MNWKVGKIVLIICLALLTSLAYFLSQKNRYIEQIHQSVVARYPDVNHLNPTELKLDHDILIFDVRETNEYETSHISNAIRISPSIDAEQFYQEFGSRIANKRVVFYCALGVRSSSLITRLKSETKLDTDQLYNLKGGIYGWHAQKHELVNSLGKTREVYAHNSIWQFLLGV